MGGAVESYIRCSLVRYEVPYSPIGGTWEVDWSLAGGSLEVPARSLYIGCRTYVALFIL